MKSFRDFLGEATYNGIPLDKIDDHQGVLEPKKVQEYQAAIRNKKDIPAITVQKYQRNKQQRYFVHDGSHRLAAHKAEGETHIYARIVKSAKEVE